MTPAKKTSADEPAEAATRQHADIAGLSYEAARNELAGIVERLEGGQVALEESMRLWERGEALADHCAAWLDGAERRLRRVEAEDEGDAAGSAHGAASEARDAEDPES